MEPFDGPTIGPDGALYGTAQFGGLPIDADRAGVIFRMDRAGKKMAGLAPAGGAVVTLWTDRPDVIALPSSVKVGAGWAIKPFTVTARSQSEAVTVTMRATYAGLTRETTLEVYAAY